MSSTVHGVKRQFTDSDSDLLRRIVDALQRHGSFTHDFGSINSGATADAAVDVSSANNSREALEAGDEVFVGIEDELNDGLVLARAEVTATDEITVTVLNTSSAAIDPGSMTFFFWAPLTLKVL